MRISYILRNQKSRQGNHIHLTEAQVMLTKFKLLSLFTFLFAIHLSTQFISAQDDSSESQTLENSAGERIIYIPFKDLGDTFNDPDTDIVLPFSEYKALLAAWKAAQSPKTAPDAVISAAEYQVTIDGELARIHAKLNVNVLGKPWVELPVRFGQAAVGQVTGEDVLLRGIGDGQYALLFSGAGEKTVELDLAVRIHQSPDGQEFAFETPAVAVSTLDITVPKSGQEIEVIPQVVELATETAPDTQTDATRVRANIGATNRIAVKWHPKASLKPEMNLLASVTNFTLVNVEDGLIHTDATLKYEILRGSMGQCRIIVPSSHRILDVSATARLKSWKTAEQDGHQIVVVEFLSAVDIPVQVEVHTERKLENGQFDAAGWIDGTEVRGIHALDVVRESGQIAIRHAADYGVTVAEQEGVVRIEAGAVDPALAGSNAFTYKFYGADLTLKFNAKPVEPRLLVGHQITQTFQDEELQIANSLQYSVERAGVFELKLNVPEGVLIDNVESPRMKEFNFDENARVLTITLLERTQGEVSVQIRSHQDLPDETASLQLSLIEPIGVERETGSIYVYARDSIEVITEQDGLQGVQPLPTNAVRNGNVSLNSAWTFTRRPLVIPVRTVRKPTRLSARIGTTIDVQPELTQVRAQLDYIIEYSGIDTFRFEVPEEISDSIRIDIEPGDQSSAPIKQRTAAGAVNGWVIWTVVVQREVLGRQRFIVRYDLGEKSEAEEPAPGDAEANAATSSETVRLFRPLGIVDNDGNPTTAFSDIQGEVLVQKERSLSISADATGGDIEVIDLRELKQLPQQGTLAFRYFTIDANDPATVKISKSRHAIQEVVSTVISRGLVEVVTGEDSEGTYRCRFLLKTTERQRLLVYLPVNLEVLGTFLNEREVSLEKADLDDGAGPGENWTPFWVNVARTESSDQTFLLTFQFLWQVNPALGESTFGRGEMLLPLPMIGNGESSVIQELKVVIWVPEKYALVGDPSDFHLQIRNRSGSLLTGELADQDTQGLESWVTQGTSIPTGMTQFPTEGRVPFIYSNLGGARSIEVTWWNRIKMTLIISVAIALIGWILLKTSWENKFSMVLIACFAAALYGLSDSQALSQGISAARFGIILLLLLWLIRGLFQIGHTIQAEAASRQSLKSVVAEVRADEIAAREGLQTRTDEFSTPQEPGDQPESSEGDSNEN